MFQMYGRHPGGHLELELGDFVGHRRYIILYTDKWMLNLKILYILWANNFSALIQDVSQLQIHPYHAFSDLYVLVR